MDVSLRREPAGVYGFVDRTGSADRVECHVYAEEDGTTVPLDAAMDSDEPMERTRFLFRAGDTTYDDDAVTVIDDILRAEGVDGAEHWAGLTADLADDVTGGYRDDLAATVDHLYRDVRDEPDVDISIGSRDQDFPDVFAAVEDERGRAGPSRYVPGVAFLHLRRQRKRSEQRRLALTQEGRFERNMFIRDAGAEFSRYATYSSLASMAGAMGIAMGGDLGTALGVAGFGAATGPVPGRMADALADTLSDPRHRVDWSAVKPYVEASFPD